MAPTRADPVAAALSERVGGPVGSRARPHRSWTPLRVVLVAFTLLSCLSILHREPCMRTDWGNDTVRYAKMCYSDIPYLYTGRGMAERVWPYSDPASSPADGTSAEDRYQAMEYPVGISYVAWGVAELLRPVAAGPPQAVREATSPDGLWGLPGMAKEVNQYFLLTAVLMIGCGFAAVWLLSGVNRRRPWDAMAFALSPCLLFTQLINWDMLAVVCVAGALWAQARGRPILTGILLGVGTAMKLYPLFLFGALLVIVLHRGLRRRGDREGSDGPATPLGSPWTWRMLALAVASGAGAWLVLNLPALLTSPERWSVFWSFNSERGPDLGSLWMLASMLGAPASAHTVNVVSWIAFSLACLAILALGLLAPRRVSGQISGQIVGPTFAQLGFLIVAAFLLVNKVYSPQYVLWLLPLAVIARPRWRDLLIWQSCELFYFGAVWLYLGQFTASGTTGGNDPLYVAAIIVRVLGELSLMVVIGRDVLRGDSSEREVEDPSTPQSTTTASNAVVV